MKCECSGRADDASATYAQAFRDEPAAGPFQETPSVGQSDRMVRRYLRARIGLLRHGRGLTATGQGAHGAGGHEP